MYVDLLPELSIDFDLLLNIYETDFIVHFGLTIQHLETSLMAKSNDLWADGLL